MLKSQNDGKKNGNLIVKAIERSLIVLVYLVQGPNIGRDKIDVILGINQYECWIVLLPNSSAFLYKKRSRRIGHLTSLDKN